MLLLGDRVLAARRRSCGCVLFALACPCCRLIWLLPGRELSPRRRRADSLRVGLGRRSACAGRRSSRPQSLGELREAVTAAGATGAIARGMGRSYGDAAQLRRGNVLDITRLRSFELDAVSGVRHGRGRGDARPAARRRWHPPAGRCRSFPGPSTSRSAARSPATSTARTTVPPEHSGPTCSSSGC